jgi:hypothetical protein
MAFSHELLDLVQGARGACDRFAGLLAKEPVDVGVAPVDVRSTADREHLSACVPKAPLMW